MTENWYETLSATDGLPTEDDEQNRTEQNRMQTNLVVRFLTQQVGRLTYSHQGHSLHVQDDVICKDFCCEFTGRPLTTVTKTVKSGWGRGDGHREVFDEVGCSGCSEALRGQNHAWQRPCQYLQYLLSLLRLVRPCLKNYIFSIINRWNISGWTHPFDCHRLKRTSGPCKGGLCIKIWLHSHKMLNETVLLWKSKQSIFLLFIFPGSSFLLRSSQGYIYHTEVHNWYGSTYLLQNIFVTKNISVMEIHICYGSSYVLQNIFVTKVYFCCERS